MARLSRGIRYTLIGAAVLAVLVVAALIVLTRTDFGVEQAGRFALDQVRGSINGELQVGRIESAGLLRGATIHDVTIRDPDGRPFLRADSARLAYRLRTFLSGDIAFDRLILHGPEVVIERLPGRERWNYEVLFPGDTLPRPDSLAPPAGLVLIEDVTVVDGRAVVRIPWEPEGPVQPSDTSRLILEEVPGGLVRTLRFEDIDGRLPRVLWETPDEEGRLVRVGELATRAYIWETPIDIQRVEGTLVIRDSLVSFDAPLVRLPSSEVGIVGTIIVGEPNRYDVQVEGENLRFADFQWLYPALPEDGAGSLRFRMQSQEGENMLWLAEDARLRASGSEIAGSFGIVTGDTLFFTNVDLRASPLDLDLLRSLLPADLPLEGLLIGTVEVEGPISSLRTRGDVRYRAPGGDGPETTESDVRWAGTVDLAAPFGARGLRADVRRLDLAHLARWAPELRLRGVASGEVALDGSLVRGLRVDGTVGLERDGLVSTVRGGGQLAVDGGRSRFDVQLDAMPLALEILGEQFPAAKRLRGAAEGPISVTGSLADLRVEADLRTPAGGVALDGRFALDAPEPRYRAEGAVTGFRLDRVISNLPETSVTGRFDFDATGSDPAALRGPVALSIDAARVAGVEVYRGAFRGALEDGLLRVDSLRVITEVGDASASGAIGLVDGRGGELAVAVNADSLSFLAPLVFPDAPLLAAIERALDRPNRLDGAVSATGVVSGSLRDWNIRGQVDGRDLVYDDVTLDRLRGTFDWRVRALSAEAILDSLRTGSRFLPHAAATLAYREGAGTASLGARGPGGQELEANGEFALEEDAVRARLDGFALATRDGRWRIRTPVSARVGKDGVEVDELVAVRGPHHARVRVAGTLPWRPDTATGVRPADMTLELDSVRLGELLRVAQSESSLDGVVTGRFRLGGTALAPTLDGELVARPFRYGGAVLDSAGGALAYRDRRITGRFAGWQGGDAIVTGQGYIPADLALAPREGRLLDRAMRVRVLADRVPAALVAFLAPGFTQVGGALNGDIAVVGTAAAPELEGELSLAGGSAVFDPLNVRYRQIDAVARMGAGSRMDVEGRIRTRHGNAEVRGSIDLQRPSDPTFDLNVAARSLDASHRRDVVAIADGELHLGGRYTRPVVTGSVRLVRGEMNIDEIWRQYQIVQLDTSLFQLFDTTTVSYRPPPENPFLANVRLDGVSVAATRDVWVRSRELNVEVAGDLDVRLDRQAEDLRMTGTLVASRGTYDLQLAQAPGVPARRFEIRDGLIEFVGTPGIDPNLDISAGYRVRRARGEPIDVVAIVSGTLQNPRVSLTSDSDLPLSESDLASYILFGRAGTELSQAETDIISSGLSLVRPAITGVASTWAQQVMTTLGLPVDYIALRAPEYGVGEYGALVRDQGLGGVLSDAQVEVGFDLVRDVFVVGSVRLPSSEPTGGQRPGLRMFGLRVQHRFRPTWTYEFYFEDRFARTPSFGLAEIDDRKVQGFSIFREWGY